MYCQTFVSPAIGATLHTFLLLSVFIMDDLPTLGYPMNPTEICFLSICSFAEKEINSLVNICNLFH